MCCSMFCNDLHGYAGDTKINANIFSRLCKSRYFCIIPRFCTWENQTIVNELYFDGEFTTP